VENLETMSFPKFGRIAEMRPENVMLMRVKPRDRGQRIWLEFARGRLTVLARIIFMRTKKHVATTMTRRGDIFFSEVSKTGIFLQ
jgi:hypothetical protein